MEVKTHVQQKEGNSALPYPSSRWSAWEKEEKKKKETDVNCWVQLREKTKENDTVYHSYKGE